MKPAVRRLVVRGATGLPGLPADVRRRLLEMCDINLGEGSEIRHGCYITPGTLTIGDRSFINFRCTIDAHAPITIGNHVAVGFNVEFMTSTHRPGVGSRRAAEQVWYPICVGDGCWIGAGVKILPGVTIGEGCVIAAGAVVTCDCEPHGLYGGIPARRLRDLD